MKNTGIKILLLCMIAFPLQAQHLDWQPDEFWKINHSSDIQADPNGSPYTYDDALQTTTQDKWMDMQSNPNWELGYSFKSVSNIIKVSVNHEQLLISDSYKYRLDLQIKGYTTPGGSQQTKNISLVIEYNKDSGMVYNDLSLFKLDGAGFHSFETKLMDVVDLNQSTPTTVPRASLAKNFDIETRIIVRRYDKKTGFLRVYSKMPAPSASVIDVWWEFLPFPTAPTCNGTLYKSCYTPKKPMMYELEWTYVDNYGYNLAAGTPTYPSPTQVSYDFKNNSTRIITSYPCYSIPNIYERGFVVFRVRTIRPSPDNFSKLEYSAWSLQQDAGSIDLNGSDCAWQYTQAVAAHEADEINWQYSVSFAEEGKNKRVINYFDGAGHNRQTQTKINSDNNYTIAADKIYDYEGRPAIQTLPIPVWSGDLNYKPDLSINKATNAPYKAADFDEGCNHDSIPPFKETSLAALYYSPANPHQEGMQQFVPDARGYPFAETMYSPDNTNKVLWQGGAGYDFQRWKGHGTRYVYVRAGQNEINRLLGTESGFYEYYPKQIVIDPNHQANYTIFNPEGKVVATALTGAPPSSSDYPVQALPDLPVPSGVSTELLAGISQQVDNGMRRAEHSFYAEAAGLNKLRYEATVPVYDPQCGNEYLEIQAHYNIKVVDECGNVPLEQNGTVGSSNEIVTAATPVTFNGTEFSETLDPDKYTIVKSLYFPDTAMQRLSRQFVSNHTGYEDCYLTQDSFIRKTVEAAVFPCAVSDTLTTCEMRKRQMMDDLYPGGKYGQYIQNSEGNFGGEVTNNSIFSLVTELGSINNNEGVSIFPVVEAGGLYAMTMQEPQYIVTYYNLAALSNTGNFTPLSDSTVGGKKLLLSFEVLMTGSQLKTMDSVRPAPHDGPDYVFAAGPYGSTTVNPCPTCEPFPEYDGTDNPPNPPDPPDPSLSNYACKFYVQYIYPTSSPEEEEQPILDEDGGTETVDDPTETNNIPIDFSFECPGRSAIIWAANESQIPQTHYFEANEAGDCGGYYNRMFYEVLWCGDTTVVPTIDTFYRYQAPCLTSDPIVTVQQAIIINGNTSMMYIDIPLSNATPDQLIAGFNDEIAEALLPLHPEYCKLLLCETGDFETKLEYIDSFAEAQALQLHTLPGILAQDPLNQAVDASAPFTAAELSYYGMDAALTGANAGLLRRLDTMALEKAYCGCSSVEPYLYCKEAEYRSAINSMSMPNTLIKNLFFQNLRSSYLANRNLLKQKAFDGAGNACAPCSEWRMNLIAPPVFPAFFNTAGDGIVSPPNPAMVPWQDIINNGINGTTPNQVPAQVQNTATAWSQEMNSGQVNEIMEALGNCGLSIAVSNSITNTLLQASAATYGAGITPQMVKNALVQNGVSLTDLCNPFLAEYGIYDTKKYKPHSSDYVNKSPGFYAGLQAFLNRTEVNNALVNASPSGSSVYTAGLDIENNLFEKELAALLGAGEEDDISIKGYYKALTIADNYVEDYYKLALTFGSQSDTLFLSNRKLIQPAGSGYAVYSTTLTPQTDIPNTQFSSFSQLHSVLDDDKVVVPEKGYIAPYGVFCRYNKTLIQNVNGMQTAVQYYSFYNVWSRKLIMLQQKEPDAPDYCLSCIALKDAVKDYYDDMTAYALPPKVNHPYFERIFTNYLNHRFGRRHHFEEYERLMKGCALSDVLLLPAAAATMQAVFTGDAAADAYLGSLLAAYPDVNVQHFRFKKTGNGNVVLWFDLNSVPWQKLKSIKQHITANASGVTYLPAGATAEVFVRQSCAATPSFANATVSSEDVSLQNINNTYTPYKRYMISAINTEPKPVSDLLQAVEDYYNDPQNCRAGYMVTNAKLYRSDDYDNPVKQDLLSYIYAMDGNGEANVLANLAPAKLRDNIPALSGLLLSYDDTWCRNVKEDLYYYSMPGGSDAGWQRLSGILTKVRSALGNNELFPAAAVTDVSMSGSSIGNALKVFRMADGGVWYRLFAGEANMYNVYLYPSERMAYPAADYSFVTSTGSDPNPVPLPGTGGMYRFKVHMKHGTHYVDCEGFTDFPFGSAGRLENVVLYDNQNQYQCIDTVPCERQVLFSAMEQGRLLHGAYIDSLAQSHFLAMKQFFPAHAADKLHFTTQQMQHHYTLYYYDLAGNLTRTVPPAGVHPLDAAQDGDVNAARSSSSSGTQLTLKPAHAKISTYKYNSLNQLTWQETPDGGITEFFYDPAGRLVFSQNARQRPAGKYSYTLYDPQGRITETGAFVPANPLPPGQHPQQILQSSATQADVIAALVHSKPREDVVATIYDHAFLNLGNIQGLSPQQNLRKRVSAILYAPVVAQSNTIESYYAYATHFSYDAAGNVSTLVHDNPYMDYMGQRFKRIDYDYDLLSGKVNMLSYNRGLADQIYHRYRYDADNRIIKAESSRDGLGWDRDAAYEYYKHGPLAQVSIGDLQVQSLQYAYTIQGWLKAINGDVLNPEEDMGKNGENGGLFPPDVMSHALDYYAGDYKPIGSTPVMHTLPGNGISRSLYNGNIARQTTAMAGMPNLQRDYEYDQLNRIKQTVYSSMDHITHAVSSLGNAFMNTYGYDPDGNITALTRRDAGGTLLDNFSYTYYDPGAHNRLSYVADAASGSAGSDLQPGQSAGNYGYDPSGNLVKDVQEGIKRIDWNLYGKVTHLTKGTAEDDTMELFFSYDGAGNRVRKDYIHPGEAGVQERRSDIYVRDAAGNILAVYKSSSQIDGGALIVWINDAIVNQDGGWISPQGWGLAAFFAEQFGSNGSFTAPLLDYAVGSSSAWVQQQTDLGTGFYLAHSAGLLLQAAAEPKLGDYLDALQTYFGGQAGALALSGTNGPELLYRLWNEGSGRIPEIKASFLSLYAAHPPTADSLLELLNLPYDPGDPFDKRADVLTGYTIQYPAATLQAYAALQDSMDAGALRNFRSALLGSPPIEKWVLDRQQEALAAKLQRRLVKQDSVAVQDSVIAFFTQWLPDYDEDWLPNHATPLDQLNIVYESDRTGFLVAWLDEFGIAPVNAVLKGIKGLTGTAYTEMVGTAVLTGTLNPSYNPPQVNTPDPDNLLGESMYLAEHHLYGSSRLGIKHYDSLEYQAIYDQEEEALTVATLNARRPWYSFSQSDWIKKDKASEFTGATYNLSLDTLRERRWIGRKEYEFTDHLGNVLVTFLDRKTGYGNSSGNYIGFNADIASITDYYPFGMPMEERSVSSADYRMGFGGHEKDNEVAGIGNHYEFGGYGLDVRIGRRWNVDPMAHLREWVSPYNFVQNNPINRVDPTGALDDWVQDADGNIKWDKDANSQETTKAGEKYLGKTLTFTFNSYIDGKLWDGPGGSSPAGDKLTSTISLTGNENEAGELTSLSATKSVKIGETPIGTARDYFPGLGSDQNKFGFTGTTLNFEQHASVSPIEGFGLGLMGYDIVNVAQKLTLSLSGNNLSVTAATDIFPSATLTMNGSQMMHYPQPSFKGTHGYQKRTVFGDNGMGGSTTTEYTPLRPAPSFHIRFKR